MWRTPRAGRYPTACESTAPDPATSPRTPGDGYGRGPGTQSGDATPGRGWTQAPCPQSQLPPCRRCRADAAGAQSPQQLPGCCG